LSSLTIRGPLRFLLCLAGHAVDIFKCSKKLFRAAGEVNPAIGAEYRAASVQLGYVVKKAARNSGMQAELVWTMW
jgi:hypothetical protein